MRQTRPNPAAANEYYKREYAPDRATFCSGKSFDTFLNLQPFLPPRNAARPDTVYALLPGPLASSFAIRTKRKELRESRPAGLRRQIPFCRKFADTLRNCPQHHGRHEIHSEGDTF